MRVAAKQESSSYRPSFREPDFVFSPPIASLGNDFSLICPIFRTWRALKQDDDWEYDMTTGGSFGGAAFGASVSVHLRGLATARLAQYTGRSIEPQRFAEVA